MKIFMERKNIYWGIFLIAFTTIEAESGVVNDLRKAIERIAPETIPSEHDRRWGDGNGHAHVRAALIGPSLSIPLLSELPRSRAARHLPN
jgi:thiamine phosphate synthase YjbQ (UPF0047 family)